MSNECYIFKYEKEKLEDSWNEEYPEKALGQFPQGHFLPYVNSHPYY